MPPADASRLGRPAEGVWRTLAVALLVAAACSVLVSTTAVLLAPRQRANRERERRAHVERILAANPAVGQVLGGTGTAEVRQLVVELSDGSVAQRVSPEDLAAVRAADPLWSVPLPPERDLAGLGVRPRYATAYVVEEGGEPSMVVLPVSGAGYASTLRGYLALSGDATTVLGLSFYEHGETPGLGAEIDDPDWLAQWRGKRVRDAEGALRLGVSLRDLPAGAAEAAFEVDGLSGATRTCAGVTALLRFWLGPDGFGPFLERLSERGVR